ncbi:hypothetical protein PAP18089_04128 [Pandoraea apista]|uniref:Uncharacterized protein n=3 Tax=Pandoraea TaxID=93217 RepID=A0A5E4XY25_9BURK|nr:hypothetical protein PEP31012_04193 [Pandoraea eparura]VVG73125.1 hypothetical protein PAP18089_04128 [Pandoraea apista]
MKPRCPHTTHFPATPPAMDVNATQCATVYSSNVQLRDGPSRAVPEFWRVDMMIAIIICKVWLVLLLGAIPSEPTVPGADIGSATFSGVVADMPR